MILNFIFWELSIRISFLLFLMELLMLWMLFGLGSNRHIVIVCLVVFLFIFLFLLVLPFSLFFHLLLQSPSISFFFLFSLLFLVFVILDKRVCLFGLFRIILRAFWFIFIFFGTVFLNWLKFATVVFLQFIQVSLILLLWDSSLFQPHP